YQDTDGLHTRPIERRSHDLLSLLQRHMASARREDQPKRIRAEVIGAELLDILDLLRRRETTDLNERPLRGRKERSDTPTAGRMHQLPGLRLGVGGTHQGFPDQDSLGAPGAGSSGAERVGDTTLGN